MVGGPQSAGSQPVSPTERGLWSAADLPGRAQRWSSRGASRAPPGGQDHPSCSSWWTSSVDREWPAANITFFDFSDERLVAPVSPREIVALAPPGLAGTHPRVYLLMRSRMPWTGSHGLKSAGGLQARRGPQPGVRFVITGSRGHGACAEAGRSPGKAGGTRVPIEGLTLAEFLRISSPTDPEPTSRIRDPRMYARYLSWGCVRTSVLCWHR